MSKSARAKGHGGKRVRVGKELVQRLKRFTEALATTENLPDRFTCRTIKLDLQPKGYDGNDVRKVRKILGVSQALFAQFAGVSAAAVQDWEQEIKPPNGAVCRLMDEILYNPSYFQKRIRELATPVGNSG
jgi:putative transcriptional regulator